MIINRNETTYRRNAKIRSESGCVLALTDDFVRSPNVAAGFIRLNSQIGTFPTETFPKWEQCSSVLYLSWLSDSCKPIRNNATIACNRVAPQGILLRQFY